MLRALVAEAADDAELVERLATRLTTDEATVPFGSYLPAELHRQFKATCAEHDIEMQHALAAAIRTWLTARTDQTYSGLRNIHAGSCARGSVRACPMGAIADKQA